MAGEWRESGATLGGVDEMDPLEVLRIFVEAHSTPHPSTRAREPIMYVRHIGGATLRHHALNDGLAGVDQALLEELSFQGLLDIDYREHLWHLTPTPSGRNIVEQRKRVSNLEPSAEIGAIADAVAAQAASTNKLAWPAVRPVLMAIRRYWEAGGFSPHGVQVPAVINALPEDHVPLFAATVRALVAGDYLRPTTDLAAFDLPAEVVVSDRGHAVVDGWPGAAPADLAENLLAVLAAEESSETDPVRKTRLARVAETVKDVGVSTAGEVLAKVLMGG